MTADLTDKELSTLLESLRYSKMHIREYHERNSHAESPAWSRESLAPIESIESKLRSAKQL